jgi:hypothetical protein
VTLISGMLAGLVAADVYVSWRQARALRAARRQLQALAMLLSDRRAGQEERHHRRGPGAAAGPPR